MIFFFSTGDLTIGFLSSIIFRIMAPTATKDPDTKDEVKVKSEKRKKSDSSGSKVEKEPVLKQPKQEKTENIYDEILKLESRESEARPASKDLELWKETCGELR